MNVCVPEIWSRFDVFAELAKIMNRKNLVIKIKLYDIDEMKGRPLNTSMICDTLNQQTESKFISLKKAILKVANNYKI